MFGRIASRLTRSVSALAASALTRANNGVSSNIIKSQSYSVLARVAQSATPALNSTTTAATSTSSAAMRRSGVMGSQPVRHMNRNARRPKRANRGKRPVSNCRRRMKKKVLSSESMKQKIFGFWY